MGSVNYTTTDGAYYLSNTNKLLRSYDGLIGGKTGYDDDAGWCLVEVARRAGSTMISVTLDGIAPDDWYDDNRVLLDYAFEQKAAAGGSQAASRDRVSFLDPDAAVISRASDGGATFYGPQPVVLADADDSGLADLQVQTDVVAAGPPMGGRTFWLATAATAVVLCTRGVGVFLDRRRYVRFPPES